MRNIDELFISLSKSKFRSSFYLKDKDKEYVLSKGIDTIQSHAYDFILNRLCVKNSLKDGKQTPYRGHPVFIAQHATGTCCRGCLEKWHHINQEHNLTEDEINYIVNVIVTWIKKQMDN